MMEGRRLRWGDKLTFFSKYKKKVTDRTLLQQKKKKSMPNRTYSCSSLTLLRVLKRCGRSSSQLTDYCRPVGPCRRPSPCWNTNSTRLICVTWTRSGRTAIRMEWRCCSVYQRRDQRSTFHSRKVDQRHRQKRFWNWKGEGRLERDTGVLSISRWWEVRTQGVHEG